MSRMSRNSLISLSIGSLMLGCIATLCGNSTAEATTLVFQDTNFESLTTGQLTTDATGATAGQGGWFTRTTGTGGATNWNIAADPDQAGTHGKVLATRAGNTATGNNATRFAWTNDVHNNILSNPSVDNYIIKYDFYMGGASTTSRNRYGLYLYDSSLTKILAGVTVQNDTGQLYIVGNYNNAGTLGNYAFSTGVTGLSRNTWYGLIVSFDRTTGRFEGGYSTDGGLNYTTYYVDGAAAGITPDQLDLIGSVNSGTAAQGVTLGYYDNIYMYSEVSGGGATASVPAPLPLLGAAGALRISRRLRHLSRGVR